jgi:Tol biopolymer transport system component
MDTALAGSRAGRLPTRALLVALLLLLLAAAAALVFVGSRPRFPPPYGLADNGHIAYGSNGDIFVRDALTAQPRLLIGGDGDQGGVLYSLDGRYLAYDNVTNGVDYATVADADGSNPRRILDVPFNGSAAWSPDSRSMALTTDRPQSTSPTATGSDHFLYIAAADGSGAREISIDGVSPLDVLYNPANDGTLLIRGTDKVGNVDVYLVDLDGRVVRRYGLPGTMLYGKDYELSGLAFSPDGRTIAHNSVDDATGRVTFRTWLIGVDGSNHRLLPLPLDAGEAYSQAWPIYSPDGRWIAMESWVGAPGGIAVNQIAIAPADGSAPAHGVGPAIPNESLLKAWSPDGKTLLLGVRDQKEVYQIDPATGVGKQLPWSGDLPDWQRTLR